MSRGLAYDSDEGRNFAAALTAIMHGEAYKQSRDHRPRPRRPVRRVPGQRGPVPAGHRQAPRRLVPHPDRRACRRTSIRHAHQVFDEALELGKQYGYRNAQVTVLAPTGTIAFMMDCDTTGVEPDIALIKYKKLVGEGFLKIVNQTVPAALKKLGYTAEQIERDPRLPDRARDHRGRAAHQAGAPARSSTAPSSRPTARGPSTTWATSG